MSRFSLRSVAMLAALAGTPIAAHFYSARSGSDKNGAPSSGSDTTAAATATDLSSAAPSSDDIDRAGHNSQDAGRTALRTHICAFLTLYSARGNAASETAPCYPAIDQPAPASATNPANVPGSGVHIILAIVPSPVRTHLELRFDRAIDDLQDAAQQRGWDFDSDWLPWDPRSHAESDRYGERLLDDAARRGVEKVPGALLFRPSASPVKPAAGADTNSAGNASPIASSADAPLLVLLVGDTPVAGVDPDQFREAVRIWRLLRDPGKDGGQLKIVGPSFSGSVQSVLHLLPAALSNASNGSSEPACGGIGVDIASGTVTSNLQLGELSTVCPGANVISFAMDGQYESSVLLRYLRAKSPWKKVASLSEEETAYGFNQASAMPDLQRERKNPRKEGYRDADLVLRFPRGISRLREAYEQNGIIGFAASSNAPRSELQFVTGEKPRGTDSVPSFSGTQQTLSMESQMAEMAATLNQERITTVLLTATDVFDEIFVARYLQQHSPRVTVVIQDADLLFLRSGQDAGLQDTYVASPWPLIPANQVWTAPLFRDHPDLNIYPSQGDEGFRAAVLHLMCMPGRPCEAPPEYNSPFAADSAFAHRPPLWLSMIGRGNFAPVALVDRDLAALEPATDNSLQPGGRNEPDIPPVSQMSGSAQTPTSPPNPKPPAAQSPQGISLLVPLQTKLLIAAVALMLIWHGMACVFSRYDRRFAWSYALADASQRGPRLWVQALLSMLAVPALRLLVVPSWPGFQASWQLWLPAGALQLLAMALATLSLLRWRVGRNPEMPRRNKSFEALRIFAVTGLVTLFIDFTLWPCLTPSAPSEHIFFLYRNGLMRPGTSPSFTLLLMLAAIAFWGHSYFARRAFFGHRIPKLPESHAADLNCPSPASVAPVTNLFADFGVPNRLIMIGCVLLVCLIFMLSNSWGPTSLESGSFDWWARALTLIVATAMLNDIAMAVWGWNLLYQCCLLPLKYSPLRWGFSWIKGFSWRRLWTSSYVLSPDLIFDYVSRLTEDGRRQWDRNYALIWAHQALVREYRQPGNKDMAWSNRVAEALIALHIQLANHADDLLTELKAKWAEDHGPLTGADTKRGFALQKEADSESTLDRMAAEEFVAVLYLGYIRMVLLQIRNRVLTSLICYVLLLWALTSYMWTNHHAIIVALSALLALLSCGVVYVYSGMHRDEILSRTTETDPGKLDPEFFEKTIPTLGIPLLSLVATQFPEFSDLIFSFIEPGLRGH